MKGIKTVIFFCVLIGCGCMAQTETIDSLKTALNKANTDTTRLQLLNQLTFKYRKASLPDSAIHIARQAELLGRTLLTSPNKSISHSAKKSLSNTMTSLGSLMLNKG